MKKLLSMLISAALIAAPLAVISTPAAAETATPVKTIKKAKHAKAKSKARAKHRKMVTKKAP